MELKGKSVFSVSQFHDPDLFKQKAAEAEERSTLETCSEAVLTPMADYDMSQISCGETERHKNCCGFGMGSSLV